MLKSYILKTRVLGEDPLEVLILSGRPFVNRIPPCPNWASLVTQMAKKLPSMQETLGQENPLEKEIAALSRILAWRMPWTEDPGGLQFMASQRVRQLFFHSLSRFRDTSMPRMVHPHLWVQRGPWGRQALECVFLSQHKGPFCGSFLTLAVVVSPHV